MGITVNTSPQQITASVGETKIDVTVSGGIGPSGAVGGGYVLPTATASVLGGVKIGSGISIDGNGVISASSGYTLPTATNSVLGGVKIGSGVTITDGVISVSTNYAAATHTHAISDVTDLASTLSGIDSALGGKAAITDIRYKGEWSAGGYGQGDIVYKSVAAGSEVSGYIGTLWVCTDIATSDEPDGTTSAWTRFKAVAESHAHSVGDISFTATDRLLGRSSSGAGVGEEITCTSAGRALLDDADAAAQRSTLSAQKTITSGTAAPTGGADGDIYLQYTA